MDFGMFVLCAFIATTKMVLTANHADYNQTCERTSDCYADIVAYNFECVGHDTYTATSCNTGRCLCPNTRYLQPLAFTLSCDLKKRELDDYNNHLYECGAGLVCRHNEYGLTKCLPFKRLGEPCSANEDCAYDSDGRADSRMCQGTCQCNSGLITEGDKCRRPRVGDPCSDLNLASTCISTMLGDPSVEIETCQDGTCACPSTAEEVTVLMDGQENVFCVTKYDGTKKGDGEPCSAHNMCSSNFCVNCPGSSNVCVRQRDETAEPRPDIDECLSVSCLNGGTCINLQGGFMCECPPGFRGDTCGIGTTTRPTDSDGDVTSVRTDLVNGANQTTPIWVLIAILWMFLILD